MVTSTGYSSKVPGFIPVSYVSLQPFVRTDPGSSMFPLGLHSPIMNVVHINVVHREISETH